MAWDIEDPPDTIEIELWPEDQNKIIDSLKMEIWATQQELRNLVSIVSGLEVDRQGYGDDGRLERYAIDRFNMSRFEYGFREKSPWVVHEPYPYNSGDTKH